MKIRPYKPSDAAIIDEIYSRSDRNFRLPDLYHCPKLAVIENDEGQVIGLGAIQMLPELVLVIDTDRPNREKVEALKGLMRLGIQLATADGFNEVYAFPDSKSYAGVLQKHFNFEECNPLLIKRIDDGE
jgi:hypothetical protein